MSNFASKLWNWLIDRSPHNAATPGVQPQPGKNACGPSVPPRYEPIETNLQTESITGFQSEVGSVDSVSRGPDGHLVRASKRIALLIGCNHIVNQLQAVDQQDRHIRGIAGQCFYCTGQYQEQFLRGEITAVDAERLSLVCSDCGKITSSGLLCCPKHYTAVTNPDGTTTYLGPEDAQEQKRQNTVRMILGPITSLFAEISPDASQKDQIEHNNEKKVN